jgi:hypothetical protein
MELLQTGNKGLWRAKSRTAAPIRHGFADTRQRTARGMAARNGAPTNRPHIRLLRFGTNPQGHRDGSRAAPLVPGKTISVA